MIPTYNSRHYGLVVVTPPANEPISLDAQGEYSRVDANDSSQTNTLNDFIGTARLHLEERYDRALVTQTLRLTLDKFPGMIGGSIDGPGFWFWGGGDAPIYLPRPPLQSIISIQYVDGAGVTQTMSSSDYQVDTASQPGRVMPVFGKLWPVTQGPVRLNAVTITYVAGYGGPSSVPAPICSALKTYVQYCNENREQHDLEYLDRLFDRFWSGNYS